MWPSTSLLERPISSGSGTPGEGAVRTWQSATRIEHRTSTSCPLAERPTCHRAVGPVYAETPAIAASVNFTWLPLPDTVENPGVGCGTADEAEACVLHATDCLHGCSDDSAAAAIAFVSCYEAKFHEMLCSKSDTADR